MSKIWLKRGIWAVLLVVGLLVAGSLLSGAAGLVNYFQRGADPASALNIVPNKPVNSYVKIVWLPEAQDTGRKVEPFTRTEIESAYIRAWLQWNISYGRGEAYGLKTYFAGPALNSIETSITDVTKKGWKITQSDLSHDLRLNFYSADGSIVSFTDTKGLVTQTVKDSKGGVVFAGETTSSYDVVMFLEDGNWRIRHLVRRELAAEPEKAPVNIPAGIVKKDGTSFTLDNQQFLAAGVNYYPQDTPWDKFWPNYKPQVIERDFALIQSLGLNTVRTFIPFEQFGGAEIKPAFLDKLDDLLKKADEHNLKIIITLFDFRADYTTLLWPAADRHLETILTRYRDNPAVLAWDVKNEPDLDYKVSTRELVDSWLTHVLEEAHDFDPNHMLTVGWSTPAAAGNLANKLDFVSFHFFAPATELSKQYNTLRAAVPDKPIMMTESGLPTWNSFFFPGGHSEPEQAEYFSNILTYWRTTGSPGYLAWTLYDFSYAPATVAGGLPWQTAPQKEMGVVKAGGKAKPAAALLNPAASLTVPQIPAWARLLKPFWLMVATVILLVVVIIFGLGRWTIIRVRSRSGIIPVRYLARIGVVKGQDLIKRGVSFIRKFVKK